MNVSRIFCEFVFLPFSPILFCRLFLVQFLIKNNHVADFTMKRRLEARQRTFHRNQFLLRFFFNLLLNYFTAK